MKRISDLFNTNQAKNELSGDRITVGVATCGISAGAVPTLELLKDANLGVLVELVGCSGMCYNEPIVVARKNGVSSIYSHVVAEKAYELINCIREDKIFEELFVAHSLPEIDYYKKQCRLVMENCGHINPLKIEQYVACGGFSGLEKALEMEPAKVVDVIKDSRLRGRGGAGFPTGVKWSFVSGKKGKKYLICNGDEGDPGAFMNRTLMESDPFRLLEGMLIAAYAIGCDEAFVYTRTEYPLAVDTMRKAIKILEEKNLLGSNILGKEGFNLRIRLRRGAGAFVCGEETAMMNSIMGGRGYPRPRPPYPAEKGLWDCPTIINNVDTLATVAVVMKIDVGEYKKIGTEKTRGTKTICLAGKINRPGVIEVPFGMPLKEIIEIGGGVPEGTELKAVQTGGPAGGCIPKSMMDMPLDYETLTAAGSIMGSGGCIVLTNQDCMVDVAKYFMGFTQDESCGKCTPCREGNMRLLELLERVSDGVAEKKDLELIRKLAVFIRDCSLCGLGKNAPNPVLSTLKYFMDEYLKHVEGKTCPAGVCKVFSAYWITEGCVGCGNCARVCPADAIKGMLKERHVIDQDKCTKCGKCYQNCAFHAIEKDGSKKG